MYKPHPIAIGTNSNSICLPERLQAETREIQ